VAYTVEKEILGSFTCNFDLLPDAKPEEDTTKFWSKNQAAYDATRTNLVSPQLGTEMFVAWLSLTAKGMRPLFVAYPASYDFKWIDYYCIRFTDHNPFGHSGCIDIKSYAWAKLGGKFSRVTKRIFPKTWFDTRRHTHIALDDAHDQGAMFINIIRESQGLSRITDVK